MHYKNGREAKNGDKVIWIPKWTDPDGGNIQFGSPVTGILYDAVAGNDYCNGKIAITSTNDPCPNLQEVLSIEDIGEIQSKPETTEAK